MMKKIFGLFVFVFLCYCSVSQTSALELKNIDMNVQIQQNGSAHIEEKWIIDVDEGTEIYKIYNNMNESKITHLQVMDEKGNHYQNIGKWDSSMSKEKKNGKCGIIVDGDHYELCFGIGEYGLREYVFSYDISHFVKQYEGDQGMNIAFLSDFSLKPNHVRICLSSPYRFSNDNSQIWSFGYEGDVFFNNGQVVLETSSRLPSNGKMQLLMRIDDGTFTNASAVHKKFEDVRKEAFEHSDYEHRISKTTIILLIVGGLIFVILILLIVGYVIKSHRIQYIFNDDQELKDKEDIDMFRDIPCQKDMFLFYYLAKKCGLINKEDNDGLIAAILLKWVKNGYIELNKTQKKVLFFNKEKSEFDIQTSISLENSLEQTLFDYIKRAAGRNQKLEEGELEEWFSNHYENMTQWFESVDDYIEQDLRKKGLLELGFTHIKYMGMTFDKDVDSYDVSIREEMEHIIGMKKFLEDMSLIHEKEVIEVKMWEEYLIFASILGIADTVEKQIGQVCPTFDEKSRLHLSDTVYVAHSFARSSVSAMNIARTQGSGGHSSISGGGSSFSGGGGGGVR